MNIQVIEKENTYQFILPSSLSPIFRRAGTILIGIGVALFIGLYLVMVRPVLKPGTPWLDRIFFMGQWLLASGVFVMGGWWVRGMRSMVTWDAGKRIFIFQERIGPFSTQRKVIPADQIGRINVEPVMDQGPPDDPFSIPGKLVVYGVNGEIGEELLVGYSMEVLQEFAAQIRAYAGRYIEDATRAEGTPGSVIETHFKELEASARDAHGILVRREEGGFVIQCRPIGFWPIGWIFLLVPFLGAILVVVPGVMMVRSHTIGTMGVIFTGALLILFGLLAFALHQITRTLTIRFHDGGWVIEVQSRLKRRVFRIDPGQIRRVARYIAIEINHRPVYGIKLSLWGQRRGVKIFHLQFYRRDKVVNHLYALMADTARSE